MIMRMAATALVASACCSIVYTLSLAAITREAQKRIDSISDMAAEAADGWQECVDVLQTCANTLDDCILEYPEPKVLDI